MSVYVIANFTVHDQEKYEKYTQAVSATLQQYGGKILVRDGDAKAKGCPHERLVIIEFESEEAASRWYESSEYSAIKHYREEASEGWGALVPGV